MIKEFLEYETVRNNALKLANKIYKDNFFPDVIYCSLRGGAYMANVISEYFKILAKVKHFHPVLYAGVVARSYSDIAQHTKVFIDGWTYPPENLRPGDKILLVDDIFDSGRTINCLVETLMNSRGIPREDIKVVVHDYKYFTYYKEQLPIQPDYYCRKFEITKPEENRWIHYMSHELVGLSKEELENYYFRNDPELIEVLDPYLGNKVLD
ncbi:MAG: phosphoribosyltransferase [Treponema sp.]|nr:phosphoribosyltransferase [Treponema sp.]